MKTRVFTSLILSFCVLLANYAKATSYTWTGSSSTLWSVSGNWSPSGHPGSGDDVTIPATTNKPTVNVASSCKSVTISGTTTITLSALLTVSGGLTINGGASLTTAGSAAATFNGSSSIGNSSTLTIGSGNTLTFNAALSVNGGGVLVNNGNLNSTSSTGISSGNPGTITNNSTGTITLTASQINVGGGSNMTNSGKIIEKSASTLITNNPCTFINSAGASITLTGSTVNFGAGTVVTNSGTITANSGSSVVGNNTGTSITNSSTATITISASTFTLNAGSTMANSGAISVTSGSTLNFEGNPAYINNLTSASSLSVSSSTVNMAAGTSITNSGALTTTSSTFTSTGNPTTITNNVNCTFKATSTAFTLVAGDAITNNGGTVNLTSCSFSCNGNPTVITNQNSGATLGIFDVSATSFTFAGTNSIVNYGTFTINNGSSVDMTTANNSSAITNYGTFYAGTSNSSCIITALGNQPKINNSSTTVSSTTYNGNFYLGSTSIIYPSSTNFLMTNSSSCTFTLQSDAFGSAAIGAVPNGANPSPSIVGNYNVERYFHGDNTYSTATKRWVERGYRIISSAVHNTAQVSGNNVYGLNYIVGNTVGKTTLANSTTNAFISGCTGGSTSGGNPSIYLYNESYTPANQTFTDGNFLGITNITYSSTTGAITCSDGNTYSIPVGTGVFFFFRGAATDWATRTLNPFIAPEDVTLTSTGNINQQSITVKDWYSPTSSYLGRTGSGTGGNHIVRGFNMVGNPYPCTIDWCTAYANTGITRTNISPTIYVFNPVTYQYDSFLATSSSGGTATGSGSRYIVSGQGFVVRADTAHASLVFTEAAKAATSQLTSSNLLMGKPAAQVAGSQLMRLKLSIDSSDYDDIALIFNSSASSTYNPKEDAAYLAGNGALEGLCSFSADSIRLAINSLPLPALKPEVIRLAVQAHVEGTYTLQRTALDAIPKLYEIWLIDNNKKDSLDLRNNSTYIFDVNLADTSSYGPNRFQLVIRQNPALMVHLLNFTASKATDGSEVTWTTENEENYTSFTIERSSDGGVTFNDLGSLSSSAQGTYSFPDKNPLPGANMYRLKIQDLNGTISYSNAVTLMYANTGNTIGGNIRIYPNPASNTLNVAIDQISSTAVSGLSSLQADAITPGLSNDTNNSSSYNIKIINITGSVVKTATTSQPTWQDSVSSLSPGTYIIKVTNNKNNTLVGTSTFIKL